MRITGGAYRGRRVSCPPGVIRPSMDRMRESMFAVLGNIEGLSFLDLFAGSGIIALEALSRGASRAALVESDPGKRRTIMTNLGLAGVDNSASAKAELIIRPVQRFLKTGIRRFDLVHLDPPFSMPRKGELLALAEAAGQPAPGGTLMIHHPGEDNLENEIAGLRCFDRRRFGDSRLTFYTRDE